MDFQEQKNIIDKHIAKKEFDIAQDKINELIQATDIKVEDEQITHYCFKNYIDLMLYVDKYGMNKPNKVPKTNMAYLYYILGYIKFDLKEYDEALKNLDEALKWNPVDLDILFEKAEIYKVTGDLERYKAEIEKTYPFIVSNSFLAKYYREIGYYYIEKKVYNVANALYSASLDFSQTEEERNFAINELMYIAQQEKRAPHKTTLEEIKKIFGDYNIPIYFNKRTVGMILNEHKALLAKDNMQEDAKYLSRILYEITQDTQFMIRHTIKDNETGISIKVPEIWGVLRKSEFEKLNLAQTTLFVLKTKYNEKISVVIDNGECGIGQFSELYKLSIENMKKAGIVVLEENIARFDDGFKLRQAIVEAKNNDRTIRMIQNYVRVNNYLVNISWEIPQDKSPKEMIALLNNGLAMQMVLSIQGDKDKNNTDEILYKAKLANYEKNIWRMTLQELQESKSIVKAVEGELNQRIEKAEGSYINPFYIEQLSVYTECANEIDKMIEWKKYLQDVDEVVITFGKNVYRIKPTMIKCFSNDNTLLNTQDINIEEFKKFVDIILPYLYDWNKSYIGKEVLDNQNWSIIIKAENHDMKRFSGNNNYPDTWTGFYENFIYFIERSDITFFEELFIKSLIYLVIAIEDEKEHKLDKCMQWSNNIELGQMIYKLPIQHPARVLFKTLDNLTDLQYAKLLIEARAILEIFIEDYPEENNNILFTIASEQDVDKVASRIVGHFKEVINGGQYNYDKMEAVVICKKYDKRKFGKI